MLTFLKLILKLENVLFKKFSLFHPGNLADKSLYLLFGITFDTQEIFPYSPRILSIFTISTCISFLYQNEIIKEYIIEFRWYNSSLFPLYAYFHQSRILISIIFCKILIEKNDSSTVVVCLHTDIYFLSLYLSFLDFWRFFISKLSQFFKSVFFNNVELYFCGKRIETISLFVDFQLDYSFLSWVHFDCKLIFLSLSNYFDIFSLFEGNCLTKIVIIMGFVGIVIVHVSCDWTCDSLYSVVFGIFVYSFFLCEFLMKNNNLVEKFVQIKFISILN